MSKLSKNRLQKLAGLLKEADVVDLAKYKQDKEREDYHKEVIISSGGEFMYPPDEWKYVVLTHRDQADALMDLDIEKAEELGAKFYEVAPGNEVEIQNGMNEDSISERMSPEFAQDLTAYFGTDVLSPEDDDEKENK